MLSFVHRRRESNQFTFLLLKMLINITKRKPNRKTDMLVDVYMSGRITMGEKMFKGNHLPKHIMNFSSVYISSHGF